MAFKDIKKKTVEPAQVAAKPVKEFAGQGLPEPARGLSASDMESLKRAVTEELRREYLGMPSEVKEKIAQLEKDKANAELEIVRLKDETAKAKQAKAEAETETAKVSQKAGEDHDNYKVRLQELKLEKEQALLAKAGAEAKVAEAEKGKAEAEAATGDVKLKRDSVVATMKTDIESIKAQAEARVAEANQKTKQAESDIMKLHKENKELLLQLEGAKTATAEAVAKAKSEVSAVNPELADKVKELDGLMDEAGPLLCFVEELSDNVAFRKLVAVARDLVAFHENMENASLNSKVQSLLETQDQDVCMDELRTLVAEFGSELVKGALEIASVEAELDRTRKMGKKVLKLFPELVIDVSAAKQQVEDALRNEDPAEELGNLVEQLSKEAVVSLLKGIKREDSELAGKAADALKEAGAE